jgi:hypothetical protein
MVAAGRSLQGNGRLAEAELPATAAESSAQGRTSFMHLIRAVSYLPGEAADKHCSFLNTVAPVEMDL